jgi:hypothetical protein
VGEHLGFSVESQIMLNETMTRLVILLWDFVTKVPQVIMPHFDPNLFAQTIEKYKVSVSRRHSRDAVGLIDLYLTESVHCAPNSCGHVIPSCI